MIVRGLGIKQFSQLKCRELSDCFFVFIIIIIIFLIKETEQTKTRFIEHQKD